MMLCSSMYRALSTMQLICCDWYGDVDAVGLDLLRPRCGSTQCNKRSSADTLAAAFRKVSFAELARDADPLSSAEAESESKEAWVRRLHEFVSAWLCPQSELLQTQYGTLRTRTLDNVGWTGSPRPRPGRRPHAQASLSAPSSPSPSRSLHSGGFASGKRVVVVSHRATLRCLLEEVVSDISPALRKAWRHGDLRKVFVYTKQQLGTAPIPHTALRMSLRHQMWSHKHHRQHKQHKQRSKTPTARKSRSRETGAANGSILMTSTDAFDSHLCTLTSMSKQLLDTRRKPSYVCGQGKALLVAGKPHVIVVTPPAKVDREANGDK